MKTDEKADPEPELAGKACPRCGEVFEKRPDMLGNWCALCGARLFWHEGHLWAASDAKFSKGT